MGNFLFEAVGRESTKNLPYHECTGFQITVSPIPVVFPKAHARLPKRLTSEAGHMAGMRL